MSVRRLFLLLPLAFALLSCWTGSARSTTAVRLSLQEMTDLSTTVVHGRVLGTGSRWNEAGTMIVTDVRVEVEEALKGSAAGEITVTQLGGEVGKLKTEVPGAAAFRRGEEAVLFLAVDGRGGLQVTGLSQGRFEVVDDARTGRKVLRGLDRDRLQGLVRTGPAAAPSLAAPDGTIPLSRFLDRVRDLVRNGGTGGGR